MPDPQNKKDQKMTPTEVTPEVDATKAAPQFNKPKIHWAASPGSFKTVELEEKLEAMRSRNWITERMIQQSQKHWNCTREQAIERLLAQTGK